MFRARRFKKGFLIDTKEAQKADEMFGMLKILFFSRVISGTLFVHGAHGENEGQVQSHHSKISRHSYQKALKSSLTHLLVAELLENVFECRFLD
jgi:hypothetical protein